VILSPNATNLVARSCGTFTTETGNVQLAVCCLASRAVHVALVVPTGNTDGAQLVVTGAVPPVTIGAANVTGTALPSNDARPPTQDR
jgi:hypothetical protein